GGPAGQDGLVHRWRRLLPDDESGARHLRHQRHPDQGRGDQQQLAGHGAPVAEPVLRPALLEHRAEHGPRLPPRPRLRQARRGLRLRGPALRAGRGHRRHHPPGDGDRRPPRRRGLHRQRRRDGVADGAGRRLQRRDPDRAGHEPRVGEGHLSMATNPTDQNTRRQTTSGTSTTDYLMTPGRQTPPALVEHKPGALTRVTALFSRRGYNISSLAVGPTEHPEISRITVVVDVEQHRLEQITKQLNKLVNVLKIVQFDARITVQRELILIKVTADNATRTSVLEIVQMFRAKVVDAAADSVTIEATGTQDKLTALLGMLESFGIREIVKSGEVAIGRGGRAITDRSLLG